MLNDTARITQHLRVRSEHGWPSIVNISYGQGLGIVGYV